MPLFLFVVGSTQTGKSGLWTACKLDSNNNYGNSLIMCFALLYFVYVALQWPDVKSDDNVEISDFSLFVTLLKSYIHAVVVVLCNWTHLDCAKTYPWNYDACNCAYYPDIYNIKF